MIAILVLSLVFVSPFQAQYSQPSLPTSSVGLSGSREVPLNIRLVFIGLSSSDINSTYLTSKINVPAEKSQAILAGPQSTGVVFKFGYEIVFADNSAVDSLVSFLNSIAINEATPPGVGGFRNPYFDNSTTQVRLVNNTFYDANKVENWLATSQSFGAGPASVPGYTLFVADLNSRLPSFNYTQYQRYNLKCIPIPSGPDKGLCDNTKRIDATPHYYNRTMVEPDLELVQTRHFMTGWGGSHRFYFLDISAGPSYWTGQLPIQVASQLREVDLLSSYGRYWRTQFIADYVFGAVYNLFAPDQIYPVNYSAKYNFDLFVFDARNDTEKNNGPRLASTINVTLIQNEMKALLPYANVTVNTKFANITQYTALATAVGSATTPIKDPAVNGSIVDARLVYDWLSTNGEGHVSQFINATRSSQEYDVPAFIFAFTGPYNFGFTFKEEVFSRPDPGSIFGVALGDLVLISHGQYDLTRGDYLTPTQPGKGIGFTRTVIHELGHMLSLTHPFGYDTTEDFTDSVMGYYANSLTFSQFDKDMVLRGVNDELLIFAQVTLANTTTTIFNSGRVNAAKQAMASANQKYASMNYTAAVSDSLSAALNAFAAHQLSGAGSFALLSPSVLFGIIGLVIGVPVGLLVGYLVFRRRPVSGVQYYKCPTCLQPLRWDPAMMRWYCDRCQKPI